MRYDYSKNDFTDAEKAEMFDAIFGTDFRAKPQVDPSICPHCLSETFVKNGHDKYGNQRFLCRNCGKIFISTTKTSPFHGLKIDKKQAILFLYCYHNNINLKETARITSISERECFRLRHHFASFFDTVSPEFTAEKSEYVQVDGLFYRENRKGQKQDPSDEDYRKPRHNGHSTTYTTERDCIIFGASESGKSFGIPCGKYENASFIRGFNLDDTVVFTDGKSCYNNISKWFNNVIHVKTDSKKLGMVNALHSRFRQFIRRFVSVSSKYLFNYIAMFLYKDNNKDGNSFKDLMQIITDNRNVLEVYKSDDFMQFA